MAGKIYGVALSTFKDPIHDALTAYQERSDGRVRFDRKTASRLELAGPKGYSARSDSPLVYRGINIGSFVVLAFGHRDATGDALSRTFAEVTTSMTFGYNDKFLPRDKPVDREAHLTIASQNTFQDNASPVLFAGNLDLIGVDDRAKLVKFGEIGQNAHDFALASVGVQRVEPTATYTVARDPITGERYGDPHAVASSQPHVVQVCGFIALGKGAPDWQYGIFEQLGAVAPHAPTEAL